MTGAPLPPIDGIESAAVVGLGLIGGSIARDLLDRGVRVLAHDSRGDRLRAAAEPPLDRIQLVDTLAGVEGAELVVLAVPVTAAPAVLARLLPHLARARLVVDVGSAKRTIVAAAEVLGVGERFVGCHPLAGDHRSGWEASRAGLFTRAPVYLCPSPSTGAEALARARALWTALGARPELIDAAEHDRLLAWTSHLPQSVATALACALDAAGVARASLGPGGRDATRLAGSSPEMWAAVAADNAEALAVALAGMEAQLAALRAAVEAGDAGGLRSFFAAGREWYEER